MKVADLYARLGVEVDKASFTRAKRQLETFSTGVMRAQTRAHTAAWGALGTGVGRGRGGGGGGGGGGVGPMGRGGKGANRGGVGRGVLSALRGSVSAFGDLTGGRILGYGGAAGASYLIGSSLHNALKFDESLTRININSRHAMGSLGGLRDEMLKVSFATGVAKEDIMESAAGFVELTGKGDVARKMLGTFARVQLATNAEAKDIAAVSAAFYQQLGVQPEDMEKAHSITQRGAKIGAVEYKDEAKLLAEASVAFKGFGGSQGVKGVAVVGAMFETMKQNFGTPNRARTGLVRFIEALASPKTMKYMKGVGVELYKIGANGARTLKPAEEILDLLAKTPLMKGGKWDAVEGTKAFGTIPGRAGVRALLEHLDVLKSTAREMMGANDIAEDSAEYLNSAAGRTKQAWNEVKVAVAEAFTPERLQAFSMILRDIVEGAGKLPGFFERAFSADTPTLHDENDEMLDAWRNKSGASLEDVASGKSAPHAMFGLDWSMQGERERIQAAANRQLRQKQSQALKDFQEHGYTTSDLRPYLPSEMQSMMPRPFYQTSNVDSSPEGVQVRRDALMAGGVTNNVTFQIPPGSDPASYAAAVMPVLASFWDNKVREATAGAR